jgi:hypothetical protein
MMEAHFQSGKADRLVVVPRDDPIIEERFLLCLDLEAALDLVVFVVKRGRAETAAAAFGAWKRLQGRVLLHLFQDLVRRDL